jgi:hypothetical protein
LLPLIRDSGTARNRHRLQGDGCAGGSILADRLAGEFRAAGDETPGGADAQIAEKDGTSQSIASAVVEKEVGRLADFIAAGRRDGDVGGHGGRRGGAKTRGGGIDPEIGVVIIAVDAEFVVNNNEQDGAGRTKSRVKTLG